MYLDYGIHRSVTSQQNSSLCSLDRCWWLTVNVGKSFAGVLMGVTRTVAVQTRAFSGTKLTNGFTSIHTQRRSPSAILWAVSLVDSGIGTILFRYVPKKVHIVAMSDFGDEMDVDAPSASKDVIFSSEATKGKRSTANLPVEAEDSLPW